VEAALAITQFVGIDVSAKTLLVEIQAGQAVEQLEFANDTAGHRALIKRVTKQARTARVALEATGVYSLDLALALHRAPGIEVMVVNPRAAKRFGEALMTRSKSDPVDARVLRELVARMPFEPWHAPSAQALELRAITRRLHALVQAQTRERNRLHAVSSATLSAIVREDLELHIAQLAARIENLRAAASAIVNASPELHRRLQRITSIPGFAQVSATQLLGELALMPDDMSVRQWVAHAGLDPRHHTSGSSVNRPPRISKMGNRYLRAPLYMPALVAIQREPRIRAFYHALLQRQKKPLQAIVAVMRKLLHAVFGVISSDTPFNANKLFPTPTA
jgi:transposase